MGAAAPPGPPWAVADTAVSGRGPRAFAVAGRCPRESPPVFRLIHLFQTSIGSKLVMAATGAVLVLFVLVHMLGNLTIYQGPEAINAYTAWLQGHPFLWAFRALMVVVAVLHVWAGLRLARANRRARTRRYRVRRTLAADAAGRSMALTGVLVLLFVAYHLLHLTLGVVGPVPDAGGGVYARVVAGFGDPWIAGIYAAAVLLLGVHLHHAVQSLFQTLGIGERTYQGLVRGLSPLVAAVISLGFLSIPAAVQLGYIMPPGAAP